MSGSADVCCNMNPKVWAPTWGILEKPPTIFIWIMQLSNVFGSKSQHFFLYSTFQAYIGLFPTPLFHLTTSGTAKTPTNMMYTPHDGAQQVQAPNVFLASLSVYTVWNIDDPPSPWGVTFWSTSPNKTGGEAFISSLIQSVCFLQISSDICEVP